MSSGAALSTPREHLIKITSALTATGQMAAQARVGIVDAGMAYPLGSLLTVMGRKTIRILAENSEIQERILAGLRAEPSPLPDDNQFDHLGDLMKAVVKLGSLAGKASSKKDDAGPSQREVHQTELLDKIETMLCTSVQVARQEVIQEMQTNLSSLVGAASVNYDKAQANAVVEPDKMVDSLAAVSQAVATYRKNMGPQNHAHAMRWSQSVKGCGNFPLQATLDVLR